MAQNKNVQEQARSRYSIPFKKQLKILRRIISFGKPFIWQFILAIVLGLVVAAMTAIQPRIIQIFIDEELATGSAVFRTLLIYGGTYLLTTLVISVSNYFNLFNFRMASEKTVKRIRDEMYEKIHTLGLRWYDQTSAGWIVTRLTNDTESMKRFFSVFEIGINSVFGIVSSVTAMYLLDVEVATWLVLFIPLVMFVAYLYQKFSTPIYQMIKIKNSDLNTKLSESINGMSVIQEFRQEKRMQDEFKETNDAHFNARFSMTRLNATLLSPIIDLFLVLATMVVLGVLGLRSIDFAVEVGVIYAFTSYARNLFNPLQQLMDNLSFFQDGIISGERILRLMDADAYNPKQIAENTDPITDGKIEFDNVSFSYDDENYVLHDISFTANPGETVALVGHTGSGKSSVINILMRFYEFQEGNVYIDGKSIKEYDMQTIRDNIGLVIQDPFLFYGTISDNIRINNEDLTDEEVRKAAEFVQADTFIEQLPNKYDQRVTERGASYSSGQRQLISFASTIVREPTILILDEATANIDTETENLIQNGLKNMRKDRTTIAIAHRLSTIADSDLILVLDKGHIVERGTHDELIALDGKYKEMYEHQSVNKEIDQLL